jgi:PE-PPE domain
VDGRNCERLHQSDCRPTLTPVTTVPVTTPEGLLLDLSVAAGLKDLEDAMAAQQLAQPGEPYVIQGISQSSVISMLKKAEAGYEKDCRPNHSGCHIRGDRLEKPSQTLSGRTPRTNLAVIQMKLLLSVLAPPSEDGCGGVM